MFDKPVNYRDFPLLTHRPKLKDKDGNYLRNEDGSIKLGDYDCSWLPSKPFDFSNLKKKKRKKVLKLNARNRARVKIEQIMRQREVEKRKPRKYNERVINRIDTSGRYGDGLPVEDAFIEDMVPEEARLRTSLENVYQLPYDHKGRLMNLNIKKPTSTQKACEMCGTGVDKKKPDSQRWPKYCGWCYYQRHQEAKAKSKRRIKETSWEKHNEVVDYFRKKYSWHPSRNQVLTWIGVDESKESHEVFGKKSRLVTYSDTEDDLNELDTIAVKVKGIFYSDYPVEYSDPDENREEDRVPKFWDDPDNVDIQLSNSD